MTEINDNERIEGGGSPPESKSSERHMQVWNRFFTNAIKVLLFIHVHLNIYIFKHIYITYISI
jgi:hypothetical protein